MFGTSDLDKKYDCLDTAGVESWIQNAFEFVA